MTRPALFRPTRLFAALMLGGLASTGARAIDTYAGDPGQLGDPASWRTPEFMNDWGLLAIGAEYAYARGYAGGSVKVGLVDSGYFDGHPDLPASRIHGVASDGIAAAYNPVYNNQHGTHVTGTVGAARDGGTAAAPGNMHGVAFNANVYVGNTGKTDSVYYGFPPANGSAVLTLDQAHVANTYRAVNAEGVRILGTSFGSQPANEQYQTLYPTTGTNLTGRSGLLGAWAYLDSGNTWFQGARDVAKTGTVIVISAGNGGYANTSPRSGATYFDPTLEGTWLAVAAISRTGQTFNADGSINIPGTQLYNQCGIAKWACLTAPGNTIDSTYVATVNGVLTATYANSSGTSMAQPHATGALALIMDRFSYLTNAQAVTVLETTAVQNATINNAAGVAVTNPNAGKIVDTPDDRNGWGTVSVKNAMNGPGQFTGVFDVNTQGQSDTWSNNISDTAIKARQVEDAAEAATWAATKIANGWTNGVPASASDDDKTAYAVGVARELARDQRIYEGSLIKSGAGVLTLSGNNSYSGGTTLIGGGLTAASATAFGSGDVAAYAGTLATRYAGTVQIGGDLILAPSSVLDLGLYGSTGWLLDVDGMATLGGTLKLSFMDGFSFATGLYDLLGYDSYRGRFASLVFDGLQSGWNASVIYTANGVELNLTALPVPEPETYALMLGGIGLVGWFARRRRDRRDRRD